MIDKPSKYHLEINKKTNKKRCVIFTCCCLMGVVLANQKSLLLKSNPEIEHWDSL